MTTKKKKKPTIPEAPTATALSEEIWAVVSRRHVDRKIAIEAIEEVLHTLRLDERTFNDLGRTPKGKPS